MICWIELWVVKAVVALVEAILGDDVGAKALKCQSNWDWFVRGCLAYILDARAELLDRSADNWLQLGDFLLREEGIDRYTAHPVQVVADGEDHGLAVTVLIAENIVLLPLSFARIELFVEVWIVNVKLVWADANDRAYRAGESDCSNGRRFVAESDGQLLPYFSCISLTLQTYRPPFTTS